MPQKEGRRRVFRYYRSISFHDIASPPHLSRAPLAALCLYGTPLEIINSLVFGVDSIVNYQFQAP